MTSLLDLVRGLDPARFRAVLNFGAPSAFAEDFRSAGATVLVPSKGPTGSDSPPAAAARTDNGPPPRRSASLRRELRRTVRHDLPSAVALVRTARAEGIGLIHANNGVSVDRDAVYAALVLRLPLVAHVRALVKHPSGLTHRIERLLSRRVDQFIYISRAAAEVHRQGGPGARAAVIVLDNPFDIASFQADPSPTLRSELGIPDDARIVLHVGRLLPAKGQDVLLRAVASAMLDDDSLWTLLVGGATDEAGRCFEADLRTLAEELGITDRVVLAGPRRDIAEILALAYVVVQSSTSPEGFGRVVVEAMAAGRPVVGTADGGVVEIIEDGVTGRLVPPGAPDALGTVITELLGDPTAARELGRRAQDAVTARFDAQAHVDAVERIYDGLLESRNR